MINGFQNDLNELEDDAFSGIAIALSLNSPQMPSAPGKTAVSMGAGFFEGKSAVGVNAVHALEAWSDQNGTIGVGISGASGLFAGKVSVGFEF
ncbi:MAG: YadA C-terminal domain-containing protein [Pseudomonadales bacterium]|nr:YadA C-terminal domain-containing protein [Pseudomonadales bacterium]